MQNQILSQTAVSALWDTTHVIEAPVVHEVLASIAYALPLRLLSYHVAIIKGNNEYQTHILAKSVTIE